MSKSKGLDPPPPRVLLKPIAVTKKTFHLQERKTVGDLYCIFKKDLKQDPQAPHPQPPTTLQIY